MEFTYTLEEIQEAGEMILLEVDEEGIKATPYQVEKITKKLIYFDRPIGVFGYIKQIPIENIVNSKIRVSGVSGRGYSSFYVYCNAFILEKDVKETRETLLKVASLTINERIKQLQSQLGVINSL